MLKRFLFTLFMWMIIENYSVFSLFDDNDQTLTGAQIKKILSQEDKTFEVSNNKIHTRNITKKGIVFKMDVLYPPTDLFNKPELLEYVKKHHLTDNQLITFSRVAVYTTPTNTNPWTYMHAPFGTVPNLPNTIMFSIKKL